MSEGGGAAADQSVWSFGFSPKIDHHRILPNTYYTLPTTYMKTFILLHYCILTKHSMRTLAIIVFVQTQSWSQTIAVNTQHLF